MAFLTLNGVDVPVAAASGGMRTTARVGGGVARSYTGAARGGARAVKREWRFRTKPLPRTEVPAWVGLLEGSGYSWPFDVDFYSSRETPANTAAASSIGLSGEIYAGEAPRHGLQLYMQGYSSFVDWQLGAGFGASGHTVVLWANHPDYGYKHHVWRSDGARWRSGVRADTTANRLLALNTSTGVLRIQVSEYGGSTWAASQARSVGSLTMVSGHVYECMTAGTTGGTNPLGNVAGANVYSGDTTDGTVVWRNRGVSAARVSDMAVLPYAVPDAWAPALYTWHSTYPWSPLPHLTATGEFCPEASLRVRGEVGESEVVRWQEAGTWQTGEALEFVLWEV